MTKKSNQIIIAFLIIIFNIFILAFPREMVGAARQGIILWLGSVFPALFPFVFGVNILMGIGVIPYIGKKLEPVMTRLFGVPGAGGFAMVVGFTSGYPIGAKVVSELRERGELSKIQAERLISFCNNSGPLFMLGTVGASIFSDMRVGYFVLTVHYSAAIVTGLLFKYYRYRPSENFSPTVLHKHKKGITNFYAFFGDSIVKSVQTMLAVGGFITLFSVIIEIIKIMGVSDLFGSFPSAILFGFIEVANGANYLAQINTIDLPVVVATATTISFSGLSIHAQSISFISKTDISIKTYFIGKFVHALLSILLGIGFFGFFF